MSDMNAQVGNSEKIIAVGSGAEFDSLATSKSFSTRGLVTIVLDGSTRTLAIYDDGGKVFYREMRADGSPRGGEGLPSVGSITKEKLLGILRVNQDEAAMIA